jgi:hypothetical protein
MPATIYAPTHLARAVPSAQRGLLQSRHADGIALRPLPILLYSHEPNEPPHVHVDRDDVSTKFWLDPVQLAANFGFRAHELREIQSIVLENRVRLPEAWHDFFGSGGG